MKILIKMIILKLVSFSPDPKRNFKFHFLNFTSFLNQSVKECYLPSTGSGECETIIICILSPINTNTNPNDALACHCHHTTSDYGNPPGKKNQKKYKKCSKAPPFILKHSSYIKVQLYYKF